jgi:hypothetical protein
MLQIMVDLDPIKKLAKQLTEKAEQAPPSELPLILERITQIYKSLSEIDKAEAEIQKIAAEELKARHDLEQDSRQERSQVRERYVTLFTPLATTIVLCLTFVFQAYQFVKSERDKQDDAEDARWSSAVQTVSQEAKLSSIAITLNPFFKSKRYAAAARMTTIQALINMRDPIVSSELFSSAFEPMDWENLDTVLKLDRALGPRLNELYGKVNNHTMDSDDPEYKCKEGLLEDISQAIGPLLKAPRPPKQQIDFRSAWFNHGDWSNVNLSGANMDNISIIYTDLKGADLSKITSFDGIYVFGTPWWEAKQISPELAQYLLRTYPYDPTEFYGTKEVQLTQKDYDDSLVRLKLADKK